MAWFVRSTPQTAKSFGNTKPRAKLYAAPNVVDGRVLVTTEAGELISLDAETGEQQWHFQIEAPLRCWPTVVDGRVLLAGCDERVHAVDVATGKEVDGVDIDGPTGCDSGDVQRQRVVRHRARQLLRHQQQGYGDRLAVFRIPESIDAIHRPRRLTHVLPSMAPKGKRLSP